MPALSRCAASSKIQVPPKWHLRKKKSKQEVLHHDDVTLQNTHWRPLWRGAGGGGVLAGTRRPSAAGDGVPPSLQIPPHTHILLARSPALYSPFRRRPHKFSNGIFRSHGAPASLPPASSSLTHARRMDGFCNQNADQLGSLAGPPLLTVNVGVVEFAPASPTHTPPPHTGFPMIAHLSRLHLFKRHLRSLGLGLGLGLDSLLHSSSHALPFFSPPSFHTLAFFPAFTSVWWSA